MQEIHEQADQDALERLVSLNTNQLDTEDQPIIQQLRPQVLRDFVGQSRVKEELMIAIEAAARRNEPIEHVLLYGNPGLGKTTLAHIIAKETNAHIRMTAGPALEKVGDLAAILSNLERGDVLFIDEIHRLNKTVEEVLYSALEDFALDIIVGKGPAARTLRMPLEPFAIVGATTKLNLLSAPLRDRFGHVFHLNFYTPDEMEEIVARTAKILDVTITEDAIQSVARRSRYTPRVANRLLKRVRDYAEVKYSGIIDAQAADGAFALLQVDHIGLDEVDRKILKVIDESFAGGPVGLKTLAAAIAEDAETIEQVYEPYLLQLGMIERTPRGRRTTINASKHLGKTLPI